MASQLTLQKLFEAAKQSRYFSGLQENDIRQACQDYLDRSDADVEQAILNIQAKDNQLITEEAQKKSQAELRKKELLIAEKKQQQTDLQRANELLKNLFKNK